MKISLRETTEEKTCGRERFQFSLSDTESETKEQKRKFRKRRGEKTVALSLSLSLFSESLEKAATVEEFGFAGLCVFS